MARVWAYWWPSRWPSACGAAERSGGSTRPSAPVTAPAANAAAVAAPAAVAVAAPVSVAASAAAFDRRTARLDNRAASSVTRRACGPRGRGRAFAAARGARRRAMRGLVSVRVGLFAVGLAACGLGGAEPAEAPEHRVEAPGGITEAAAVAVVEERLAPASSSAGLDALPWAERIPLERALAERDPVHAPRLDEGGVPSLGAGPLTARFDAAGAHVAVGGHELALRAVAIGRGDVSAPLAEAPQTIAGPEVRAARGAGVTEWWRSLPSGLEHGLTLAERPAGEGALRVELALGGGLRATPRADDAVELRDAGGALVATYAHLVVLDADGDRVAARMEADGARIVLVADDVDARYPLVLDPELAGVEEATLTHPEGAAGDALGCSVALSANGLWALVGACLDDTVGGLNAGSALMFTRTSTTWVHVATLLAPDGAPGDQFGSSVTLDADGVRALVGAPRDSNIRGGGAGSVHVYLRAGTLWTHEATLTAADGAGADNLGSSVALNSDGSVAVVGVPGDDTSRGPNVGSARVFRRTPAGWSEDALLEHPAGGWYDAFGGAVALSADGQTALVGGILHDSAAGTNTGCAEVFVESGGSWSAQADLQGSDAMSEDSAGWSVALDATGVRALVGVYGADTVRGTDSGSVWVFRRSGSAWTQEATLVPSDADPYERVGLAVALDAAATTAVVGMPFSFGSSGAKTGGVRLFVRSGTSWSEDARLIASTVPVGGTSPQVGYSVAVSADARVVIAGANLDDVGANADAGSARVFRVGTAQATGAPCTNDAFCLSGSCVDGVCCNEPCGGGATDCQACSAALTGTPDGTCAPLTPALASGVTCRPVAGLCDTAEVCSPSSTVCPADGFRAAGTSCRGASDTCDGAEFCTGTSAGCPPDVGAPAALGTVCRPAAGDCDSLEVCDGVNALCPPDLFAALGSVCRAAVGSCDVAESCSGTSALCPSDVLVARNEPCRPAAPESCDVEEVCDGLRGTCPADVFRPLGTPCRIARGPCDRADACTGSSPVCPDAAQPAGAVCRLSLGPCDADERCDGVAAECPSDVLLPAGAVCRAAGAGPCDADDLCTGASADCLPRYLSGVVCRTAAGACDVAEVCAGSSEACPPDGVLAAGVSCRPSTGDCDFPEACDGAAAACPADRVFAAGAVCRPAAGTCDLAESCDGASGACPTERFLPEGSVCDARVADVCDTPDRCTGMGPTCPAQYLAGVECRGARGACDVPELCTGGEIGCPPDVVLSAGSLCRASTDPMCDPTEACDGTASECPADETTCMPDAGPVDAGPVGPVDGGANDGGAGDVDGGASIDAGTALIPASGCGCRAGSGPGAGLSALVALAALLGLRRR